MEVSNNFFYIQPTVIEMMNEKLTPEEIAHSYRVARTAFQLAGDSEDYNPEVLYWLSLIHAMVESKASFSIMEIFLFLNNLMIKDDIRSAIKRLTQGEDEPFEEYIKRVGRGDRHVRLVKQADLIDHFYNSYAIQPMASEEAQAYAFALAYLNAPRDI